MYKRQVKEVPKTQKIEPQQALSLVENKTYLKPSSVTEITEDKPGSEYRGRSLPLYKNEALNMIVNKKIFDQEVKFIEKAGLWNGGMHYWITIFVEIEEELFSPVKNISDLFLDIHQP